MWGYSNFGPTVARATANARQAGVSDRVRFEERDVSKGLPAQFDVITTFDVVHDAVDPLQLLQSIRHALRPGGIYVCLDVNCSDKLGGNLNPLGAMFHRGKRVLLHDHVAREQWRRTRHARFS